MYFVLTLFCSSVLIFSITKGDSTCTGLECQKTISMPFLDGSKASLQANLDVSEFNSLLKVYIQQEINTGIEKAVKEKIDATEDVIEKSLTIKMVQTMDTGIKYLAQKIKDNYAVMDRNVSNVDKNTPILMSACAHAVGGWSSNDRIRFDNVITAFGVNDLSHIKGHGKFICETPGVYFISVFASSEFKNVQLQVFKNEHIIGRCYFVQSVNYKSCSVTLFEELSVGDSIGVNIYSSTSKYVTIFGSRQACLSVQRIK